MMERIVGGLVMAVLWLGIWLSPWGGYNKPRDERVSHAAEFGYELSDGKFALSGPVYYKNFHQKVMSLIQEQGT